MQDLFQRCHNRHLHWSPAACEVKCSHCSEMHHLWLKLVMSQFGVTVSTMVLCSSGYVFLLFCVRVLFFHSRALRDFYSGNYWVVRPSILIQNIWALFAGKHFFIYQKDYYSSYFQLCLIVLKNAPIFLLWLCLCYVCVLVLGHPKWSVTPAILKGWAAFLVASGRLVLRNIYGIEILSWLLGQ